MGKWKLTWCSTSKVTGYKRLSTITRRIVLSPPCPPPPAPRRPWAACRAACALVFCRFTLQCETMLRLNIKTDAGFQCFAILFPDRKQILRNNKAEIKSQCYSHRYHTAKVSADSEMGKGFCYSWGSRLLLDVFVSSCFCSNICSDLGF